MKDPPSVEMAARQSDSLAQIDNRVALLSMMAEILRRTSDSSSTGRRDTTFRRRFLSRVTRASARLGPLERSRRFTRIILLCSSDHPSNLPIRRSSSAGKNQRRRHRHHRRHLLSLLRGKDRKSSGTLGGAITNYLREHASWAGTGNIAGR